MTSLAAEDEVSTFFNWFKVAVYQLCTTYVFKFVVTLMTTGCTWDGVLGDRNSKLDIFKEFKMAVRYIVVKTL
jgi:hypothetical protein